MERFGASCVTRYSLISLHKITILHTKVNSHHLLSTFSLLTLACASVLLAKGRSFSVKYKNVGHRFVLNICLWHARLASPWPVKMLCLNRVSFCCLEDPYTTGLTLWHRLSHSTVLYFMKHFLFYYNSHQQHPFVPILLIFLKYILFNLSRNWIP